MAIPNTWTPDRTARLIELYADPAKPTVKTIAATLTAETGVEFRRKAVMGKIERLGICNRADPDGIWSAACTDRMVELYQRRDQPSYQVIAEALNKEFGTTFTRCAVTGRVNRLKLANRCFTGEKRTVKPSSRVHTSAPRQRYRKAPDRAAVKPAEIYIVPLEPARPDIRIVDLEKGECRFPTVSDGDQHFFCGHPQTEGSSYCRAHKLRCNGPGTASERAARRVSVAA